METPRIILITAVGAICISVIMSGYFARVRKQEMKKHSEETSQSAPDGSPILPRPKAPPPPQKRKANDNLKTKRGGWGAFMLPFYSLGILAYIVYVVAKIMTKKYSSIRKNNQIKVSWDKKPRSKGKAKTKITMHELQQLEQKLQETEAAVQQIFEQTCNAVEAANKTLQSSSDEEYSARPTKRLKKMTATRSDSTDEEPNSEPERLPPARKMDPMQPKNDVQVRRRRVKRVRKPRRDTIGTSSSNSEPENTISVEHGDSDKFVSSSEDGQCFGRDSDGPKTVNCGSGDMEKENLLHTARDIRSTMSQLQSYIDDKKTELHSE